MHLWTFKRKVSKTKVFRLCFTMFYYVSDFVLANEMIAAACMLHNFIITGDNINVIDENYIENLLSDEEDEERTKDR